MNHENMKLSMLKFSYVCPSLFNLEYPKMLCKESVAEISVPQKSLIVHTSHVLFTAIQLTCKGVINYSLFRP